ncbi:MAG: hypothetical protein KGH75_00360 [Rhodospirillales bacterium]|nr:hypothetical protein [Rhodospirillales bacterium]
MSAVVWTYHRAECDTCPWDGAWHLSPRAAQAEADVHNGYHVAAAALEAELVAGEPPRR